jgi:hypothetical protein
MCAIRSIPATDSWHIIPLKIMSIVSLSLALKGPARINLWILKVVLVEVENDINWLIANRLTHLIPVLSCVVSTLYHI